MAAQTRPSSLSKNLETEGFDIQAGESWIYPTNYSTREYQYNIIQKALIKNTLVSLPTGLGKTFIAAVVMYNFYRWYPHGKIIFMAPTRPLVKQQIDACYNIMAIPQDVTAELTGSKVSSSRSNIWLEKRVFFVTPQVLQNDLEKVAELGSKIKCLVFDEAHRARGNHAYCQVIRKLLDSNQKYFRVLALSATPGGNIDDVAEVVNNLLISHLEFRTEESIDVRQYVFQRSLETVVVHLDKKITEVRNDYMQILEYYAKTLIRCNIIQGNCGNLTKGKIFLLMKEFKNKPRNNSYNYSEIMRCLNICVTLYHAYELLIRHGLRNFLSFFDEHIEKPLLRGNMRLREILENVRSYLGPIPNIDVLPDGTYPEVPHDIKFGHPKHYKLRDILVSHFSDDDKKNTRVIVFFEYRESVMEAHTLLLQSRPLIQPKIFLGQGCGVTQKTQLGVVKAFREGKCNTLLSTCIGEEGLDVGEVDLIVCFDISNKSPIRMVQRMGRTGRKREGSVLVLVTEGKEQQALKDCLIHKNNISTHVLGSSALSNQLYRNCPRLVPSHLTPKCEKLFITVPDTSKKKTQTLLDKLVKRSSSSSSSSITFSQTDDLPESKELIPECRMISQLVTPMDKSSFVQSSVFNKHIERIRSLNKFCLVKHSYQTKILNDLLCFADSKRFNIPTTNQGDIEGVTGKSLKQGDIRSMFIKDSGVTSADDDVVTLGCSSQITQLGSTEKFDQTSEELFRIVSNYLVSDITNELKKCPYCTLNFCCDDFALNSIQFDNNINQNFIPSENIINEITLENIERYLAKLDGSFYAKLDENWDDSNISLQPGKEPELDVSKPCEKSYSFEAPKSYIKLLDSIIDTHGELDYFLEEDVPEKINTKMSEKELLDFFKLDSFSDIFDTSEENISQDTIIYSPQPELYECEIDFSHMSPEGSSPICNLHKSSSLESMSKKPSLSKSDITVEDLCDLNYFTPKKHSNSPKNPESKDSSNSSNSDELSKKSSWNENDITVEDICDLDYFMPKRRSNSPQNLETELLDSIAQLNKSGSETPENLEKCLIKNSSEKDSTDIDGLCDMSYFGLLSPDNQRITAKQNDEINHCNKTSNLNTTLGLYNDPDKHAIKLQGSDGEEVISPTFISRKSKLNNHSSQKEVHDTSQVTVTQMLDLISSNSLCCEEQKNDVSCAQEQCSALDINVSSQSCSKSNNISTWNISSPEIFRKPLALKTKLGALNSPFINTMKRRNNSWMSKDNEPKDKSQKSNFFSEKYCKGSKNSQVRKEIYNVEPNEFLDREAEVSNDEDLQISDDENEDFMDRYEKSFVNDATQKLDTQMHAIYLQSIRSPAHRKAVRQPPVVDFADVFSQQPSVVDDDGDYMEDSFCVDEEDEQIHSETELSQLEILEEKLEQKRKKRKKESETDSGPAKRRRIKYISSDESD